MKNQFVKILGLGLCFIMLSAFITVHTPETSRKVIIAIQANKTIMLPCQDPPLL